MSNTITILFSAEITTPTNPNFNLSKCYKTAAVAQGDGMVMQMNKDMENNDLLGLGNQLNVARQERASGINNLLQTGFGAANLVLEKNAQDVFNKKYGIKNNDSLTYLNTSLINPFGLPYLSHNLG